MDRIRTPFMIAALAAYFLVLLIELGSLALIGNNSSTDLAPPGIGIPMLALMDGVVLFTLLMMTLALIVPSRILGAVQGIVTFIAMLLTFIGGLIMVFLAVGLLILMTTLLLAVPFGTMFYMATYADFEVQFARGILAMILMLKIIAVVFLFLAQQKFLAARGMVLLLLSSFLISFIVSILHAFVPGILVSISDAIAGIIVGIIALIWVLTKLIGAIPGIVKGLRVDRHLT